MLKRVLVAVVCVPLLFVVMFLLPPVASAVVVAAIASMSAYELLRAVEPGMNQSVRYSAVAIAALIPLGNWVTDTFSLSVRADYVGGAVLMLIIFVCAIRRHGSEEEVPFSQLCAAFFAGWLLPTFLGALVVLRDMEHGKLLILLPILIAFITDGGAYFAGVLLGKHRGITNVSPNKSLEGYIGGLVIGLAASVIYGVIIRMNVGISVNPGFMAVYGLLGGLVTELGDLSFSLIKRQYGVKDYGNLLPGHGGMMDRFDSMVFCAPVVLILVQLLPAF